MGISGEGGLGGIMASLHTYSFIRLRHVLPPSLHPPAAPPCCVPLLLTAVLLYCTAPPLRDLEAKLDVINISDAGLLLRSVLDDYKVLLSGRSGQGGPCVRLGPGMV